MNYILCIETSGINCSVAIFDKNKLIALKESNTGKYSHAENLHIFIQQILLENKIQPTHIQAVAVSGGPGSYTGLRIGVSCAKGLCFSWNVPLIALPTLNILSRNVNKNESCYIIPMLDARRMEVYSAVFDDNYNLVRDVQAEILDEYAYENYQPKKCIF